MFLGADWVYKIKDGTRGDDDLVSLAGQLSMDSTDWGRNGDFPPTRWESTQETVRLLFESKLQANGENMVGLLTMSETRLEMLATLCADDSRLNAVIQNVKLGIVSNKC